MLYLADRIRVRACMYVVLRYRGEEVYFQNPKVLMFLLLISLFIEFSCVTNKMMQVGNIIDRAGWKKKVPTILDHGKTRTELVHWLE